MFIGLLSKKWSSKNKFCSLHSKKTAIIGLYSYIGDGQCCFELPDLLFCHMHFIILHLSRPSLKKIITICKPMQFYTQLMNKTIKPKSTIG